MRLTKKVNEEWKYEYSRTEYRDERLPNPCVHLYLGDIDFVNKLGQLEDIEEELGIDLITLFKALKNGIYYFANGKQITKDYVWLADNYISLGPRDKLSYSLITAFCKRTILLCDYGKTWALTREELL